MSVFIRASDGAIGAKVAALMALPSYVNALANDTWTTTGFGPAMTPLQAVRSDGDASLTILSRCPPLVSAGLLVSANLESNTGKHACADATQQLANLQEYTLLQGYVRRVAAVAWILTANSSEATRGAQMLQDCQVSTTARFCMPTTRWAVHADIVVAVAPG